jgi:hypothetical protein
MSGRPGEVFGGTVMLSKLSRLATLAPVGLGTVLAATISVWIFLDLAPVEPVLGSLISLGAAGVAVATGWWLVRSLPSRR